MRCQDIHDISVYLLRWCNQKILRMMPLLRGGRLENRERRIDFRWTRVLKRSDIEMIIRNAN